MIIAILLCTYVAVGGYFVSVTLPGNIKSANEKFGYIPPSLLLSALVFALTWPKHFFPMLLLTKWGFAWLTGPLGIHWRGKWGLVQSNNQIHAIPYADRHSHRLSVDCPCKPQTPNPWQVVHSAWDGRK